jgi:uncharacterized secreted protein with C-terminal beta-propeller domain
VKSQKPFSSKIPEAGTAKPNEKIAEIRKFTSDQEFLDYFEKSKNVSGYAGGRGGAGGPGLPEAQTNDAAKAVPAADLAASPSRVSETNVQVSGIDEPDTVKTDGKEIFFSQSAIFPLMESQPVCASGQEGCLIPPRPEEAGGTKSIKAFPPENLNVDSEIEKSGNLLLAGNTLIIFPSESFLWSQNSGRIVAYDVSDPTKPREIWNIELKKSTLIAGARLAGGKIYLATKTEFTNDNPCPVKPFSENGTEFSLRCTEMYHPTTIVPADTIFAAFAINPANGAIEKSTSFVGSSDPASSIVYMSPSALYLTYYNPGDAVKILNSFFSENKDLVPEWLVQKLKNLEGYDISSSAKTAEIWELITRFQNSLSNDDRLKMQNEMANRAADYLARHRREIDSTGIVKVRTGDLSIDSTGSVPGKLLNQFSLDEHNGDLRAATTVGENFLSWGLGFVPAGPNNTANDVYILGDGLKKEGSVVDLGRGEQIYAVRFIGDKGYVATFKQTDPFYVLDLADPVNPEKKGELKIPGYSSYLHPVARNRILGIGEENGKVKISLFDVSDPAGPAEISKYNLDEYWTEVSETHHAFLEDAKHEIFFLPGTQGGYVFSWAGDSLKLVRAVSDIQAKRAVYIDNYLYMIGENKMVVLDERNWGKVNEIEL